MWRRDVNIRWGTRRFAQHERLFVHRVRAHTLCDAGWLEHERAELRDHRWWSAAEIAGSDETFAPPTLAADLPAVLAGAG